MKRREAVLALVAAALVILAALTVFAIELSNTQAKSKQDVEARVHERAVLAGALIDSLFNTVDRSARQYSTLYGARTVPGATLERARQKSDAYLVLLDSGGKVLAHSTGFTPQAAADVARSSALSFTNRGDTYGLGNVQPYGTKETVDLAVRFPTSYGYRTLVTAFGPQTLGGFFSGDLQEIPGVKGAHNYLLDGNDTVLGSTNPARPIGYVVRSPAAVRALTKTSGEASGQYYDQVRLTNSDWRIVLAAPSGALFASISGLRKWVPWMIFAAFALFAIATLLLGSRALRAARQVREANDRLALVNAELESTNDTLEHRAKELARSNAELEQFAAIASHDLQEPLRKIRTFTQRVTVIDADRLSEKGADYLERANSAAERMQKLIEDLLKYSRVATHGRPFTQVDLAQVTSDVLDDLEAQVEECGAIVHVGELPTISADAPQMRQLLQNLISNALKFRRPDVTPEVSIDASVVAGKMRLTVRDNGIGFEPQYAGRIFRVFERLNGRNGYPGTGIGLALCRRIAERHGGTVEADAEPGRGATFTVTLPVDQRQEVVVAPRYQEHVDGADPEVREPANVSA